MPLLATVHAEGLSNSAVEDGCKTWLMAAQMTNAEVDKQHYWLIVSIILWCRIHSGHFNLDDNHKTQNSNIQM